MRATRSIVLMMLTLGCFTTGIAGCGDDTAAKSNDQGAVTFDLTLAPTDARCAIVTVTPAMGAAVVRQFPLSPSQTAVFSLSGLPTGNVTITEQVFTVACAMTNGQMATWVADPVTVTLQAGTPVSVAFNLRRADGGGQVNVSTNFPQPPGTFQEFNGTSSAMGVDSLVLLATGPDDAIWFTNTTNNSIGRMSTAGTLLSSFVIPTPNSFTQGIVGGPDGNVWFAEQSGDKIGRVTPAGTMTEFALAANSGPLIIVVGPDGALWFTEPTGNKIGRITTGGTVTEFAVPTAAAQPAAIAVGPDRNIWFTEQASGKIGRLSLPGGTITEFNTPTLTGGPTGIVGGPDGNLWFAEVAGNKIGRITTGGTVTEFAVPTAASNPIIITVGPDGALWFTEQSGNQIGRITTAGVVTEFGVPTAATLPTGIALGADARIWFTEPGAGQIGAFRP
jgi:virginiamycin B lyase